MFVRKKKCAKKLYSKKKMQFKLVGRCTKTVCEQIISILLLLVDINCSKLLYAVVSTRKGVFTRLWVGYYCFFFANFKKEEQQQQYRKYVMKFRVVNPFVNVQIWVQHDQFDKNPSCKYSFEMLKFRVKRIFEKISLSFE